MSQIQYVRKISLSKTFHKDQLIYNSSEDNFFPEYKKVVIFNRQFGNKSKLIAKLENYDGSTLENNSDDIVKVIGEKQFETLFLALCSVINQEFRIKGIFSILNTVKNNGTDTTNKSQDNGTSKVDVQCQTDEIRISTSDIKKRRIRKHLAPYAVPSLRPPESKVRRVIIDIPNNGTNKQIEHNNETNKPNDYNGLDKLPDLGYLIDDTSNDTVSSRISCTTTSTLMNDPLSLLDTVDNHTLSVSEKDMLMKNLEQANLLSKTDSLNPLSDSSKDNSAIIISEVSSLNKTTEVNSSIKANKNNPLNEIEDTLKKTEANSLKKIDDDTSVKKPEDSVIKSTDIPLNDSDVGITENIPFYNFVLKFPDYTSISIALPTKPEDPFHIVTTENSNYIPRLRLIEIQMKIDEKLCTHPADDDGNLPIHVATLNNDLELLRRQCFILNRKCVTVDILANDLTALKLSLFQPTVAATVILLQFNADPLYLDDNHSSYFHIAAELKTDHLSVLLHYCKMNARKIILENDEIQQPGWESKSDKELGEYLLDHICTMCDNQGYTPLMLASNLGIYENVKLLLEASKTTVNKQMPNTGNTALYLAVASSCSMASGHFSKYKPTGRCTLKIDQQIKSTIEVLLHYGADPTMDNYFGSNVTLLLTEFPILDLITLISNNTKIKNFNTTLFDGDFQNVMLVKENEKIEVKNINSKPVKKNEVKLPTSNLTQQISCKPSSFLIKQNDFKPTNTLNVKNDFKPTSNTLNVQNDFKQASNVLNYRKIAPKQTLNTESVINDFKPTSNTLNVQNDFKQASNVLNHPKIAPKQTLNTKRVKNDFKPTSNTLNVQNDFKQASNVLNHPKNAPKQTLNTKSVKNDFKPTSNTLNVQNDFKQASNVLNPKQTINTKRTNKINILRNIVIKSPQTTAESTKTTTNTESTKSNKSIEESTKIMQPIYITKDNNLVILSGKSTKTDSVVATPSTNSTNLKKKVVVFKRSIQKIDFVKEAGIVLEKKMLIKRKNDEEIPSTSNKLNK